MKVLTVSIRSEQVIIRTPDEFIVVELGEGS
jgi:hypothetical protein